MHPIDSLNNLTDQELIGNLKKLITQEREVLSEILKHLKEVHDRKIHLALGYSTLFSYLTEGLGYAEASAYRRIQSMRLIQAVPEVEAKLESGDMSLTVASQLQSFFQNEDKRRKTEGQKLFSREDKRVLVEQLQGTSARECELKLAQLSPESALPKEKARPLNEDAFLLQFTVNKGLMDKIEKLKALWSHQIPDGSLEQLMEQLVNLALEKIDPILKEPKDTGALPARKLPTTHGRYISKSLRKQIWIRDRGRCKYQDPKTGKVCHSNHFIEIDHRYNFALGGEHSLSNLRLLCRNHNIYRQKLLETMNA